jgi:hypothetical protein
MEHELLERLSALRHDQQPIRLPASDERFLDRPATGDEFLLGTESVGRRQCWCM